MFRNIQISNTFEHFSIEWCESDHRKIVFRASSTSQRDESCLYTRYAQLIATRIPSIIRDTDGREMKRSEHRLNKCSDDDFTITLRHE